MFPPVARHTLFAIFFAVVVCTGLAEPADIINASCSVKSTCTTVIRDAINRCPTSGCVIQLEPGVYRMQPVGPTPDTPSLVFSGLADVTFEGLGVSPDDTTLMLTGLSLVISVEGCRGAMFRNFNFDMARLPFTVGTVVNPTAGELIVNTMHFPISVSTQKASPYIMRAQTLDVFDPALENVARPEKNTIGTPFAVQYDTSRSMMIVAWGSEYKPTNGSKVLVRHQVFGYNCFHSNATKDLTLELVHMHSCAGMGLMAIGNTNVNVFQTATLRKVRSDGTKRELSISADALHFCNCRGGTVHVKNCTFEGQGDDGLNINTRLSRLQSLAAGNTVIISNRPGLNGPAVVAQEAHIGDWYDLYDGESLMPIGESSKIVAIDETTGAIRLEKPLDVPIYTVLGIHQGKATATLIEDSVFLNNRDRALLLKQPNTLVRNNVFRGQSGSAVLTQIDACKDYEGMPVYNWTIENNEFHGPMERTNQHFYLRATGYVPAVVNGEPVKYCRQIWQDGTLRDMTVSNNKFRIIEGTWSPNGAVMFTASAGVRVTGNTIHTNELPSLTHVPDLQFINCSKVVAESNTCMTKAKERLCERQLVHQ